MGIWKWLFGSPEVKPLQKANEEEQRKVVSTSAPRGEVSEVTKGITKLTKMVSDPLGVFDELEDIREVVGHLSAAGPEGMHALVSLIKDALNCRSRGIVFAISVATRLPPTQALLDLLGTVASAPSLAPQPSSPRFRGEIEGGGKVGWAGGSDRHVRQSAAEALEKLKPSTPAPPSSHSLSASQTEGDMPGSTTQVQPIRQTKPSELGSLPPIPRELSAQLRDHILALSNPRPKPLYENSIDATTAITAILRDCSPDDAKAAVLNILDWYSEETVGPAFLETWVEDSSLVTPNLFENWSTIQTGLWLKGRLFWKQRFKDNHDHEHVETYLSAVREWSRDRNGDFSKAGMAPGLLDVVREGISKSPSWCDALARFVLLYRVARRRALSCMSNDLAKLVAYDRQSDPCAVIRGEASQY